MTPNGANPNEHDPERDFAEAEDYLGQDTPAFDDDRPRAAEEPPPRPKSANNLSHDSFDRRLYDEVAQASDRLGALPEHPAAPPTFGALLQDLFYAFFKVKPRFLEETRVQAEHARVNRPFVERLLEDERTAILRLTNTMDDMASALGALEAGDRILRELDDRPDLASWVESQSNAGRRDTPDTRPDRPDEDPDGAREPESPEASQEGPPSRDLRRAVRAALDSARTAVDAHTEALEGWGLTPADLKKVPLAERLDLARGLGTPRMARFAALLGRMRNLALSEASKRLASGVDEIHSVTTGGPLHRVLPQELASGPASRNRVVRLNFYRKMLEGGLLSYDLKGTEKGGRGPIVAMIDSSSSMAGSPMDWATALAAALAQGPAAREGRPVYLIYFNTTIVSEIELPPGERDPRKLLAAATVGAAGGTDYDVPINRALRIVEEHHQHADADLLIVTDGQCSLSEAGREDLAKSKAALGFSLYAVLCGEKADASDLAGYCEGIYHAEKDLAATAAGKRIATELLRNI